MHRGIACQGATHGLMGSKRLACCLLPHSHVPTLPKKHGGNPNPTSSMKFIPHMYSSHKKLARTSKTLIKLSSIAQLANFESSPYVLRTSYVLRMSIALPAMDRSTLLDPGIVARAVRDNARPGTTPLLCHWMMDAPPPPPPPSPLAAASLLAYGASNAPVAETAEATEHPSATSRCVPPSVPHRDRPDPSAGIPLKVRDVHEDLVPVMGDVKEVKKRGVALKLDSLIKPSYCNLHKL
jgi:hypothetical protein